MTTPLFNRLRSLLCFGPAALDSPFSRLLQAKDSAVCEALLQLESSLAADEYTDEEHVAIARELGDFFALVYCDGRSIASRMPKSFVDIYLDWQGRGQHYTGMEVRTRNYTGRLEKKSKALTLLFEVCEVAPGAAFAQETRGAYFFPLVDQVRYDAERQTVAIPFALRACTQEEAARLGTGHRRQEVILKEILASCLSTLFSSFAGPLLPWRSTLSLETLLKHARAFLRRQEADYFIPVDLAAVLEPRLSAYLLARVLPATDEIGTEEARAALRIANGVRSQALPLIRVLTETARVEQRLFEKKPLVLSTRYLISLQHISQSFWPDIVSNASQVAAWHQLYGTPMHLSMDELSLHPTLVLDTQHFPAEFVESLLRSFPDRDAAVDGILVHSENYRALRLLESRYLGQVAMQYHDVPYNTGNREYPYRNSFARPTWLTFMEERLRLAWRLLSDDGVLFVSIDEHEHAYLGQTMDEICGEEHRLPIIVWHSTVGGQNGAKHFSVVHEYILAYAKNPGRFLPSMLDERTRDGRELLTSTLWDYTEVGHTAGAKKELLSMLRPTDRASAFPTVKPTALIQRMLRLATHASGRCMVLDAFAGSASTALAVLQQNREDGGDRRFVLIEQSQHFERTVLPRIMRAMYCPVWRDGLPVDYPEPGLWWPSWVSHTPRLVQVLRLEQFDDSLETLEVGGPMEVDLGGSAPDNSHHTLHYHVSLPLRANEGFLEKEELAHPLSTSIEVVTEDGLHQTKVDVIETFNAALGLHVERVERWVNPASSCPYRAVIGRQQLQRILVLWREMGCCDWDLELPFLQSCIGGFDHTYINDPQPPPGFTSLIPIFRKRLETGAR